MSRRVSVLIGMLAFALVSCMCGGHPKFNGKNFNPKKNVDADPAPPAPPPPIVLEKKEEPKRIKFDQPLWMKAEEKEPPLPAFVYVPRKLPPRPKLDQILSASASTITDKIKVDLAEAHIDPPGVPMRRMVVKIRIHNEGRVAIGYKPWRGSTSPPAHKLFAEDESRRRFLMADATPLDGALRGETKIEPGKFVVDYIAFSPPPPSDSQEVNFRLLGWNLSMPNEWFQFCMGRQFFAVAEDRELDRIDKDQQLHAHNIAVAKEVARRAEQKRLAHEARQKQIREAEEEAKRVAMVAEEKRKQEQKEANERWEASLPKVTRRNFNKLKRGMEYSEVVEILGSGSRDLVSGPYESFVWRSNDFIPTIIRVGLYRGQVNSFSIIGE